MKRVATCVDATRPGAQNTEATAGRNRPAVASVFMLVAPLPVGPVRRRANGDPACAGGV